MHNYNIEVKLCLKVKKIETAGHRENTVSKGIERKKEMCHNELSK